VAASPEGKYLYYAASWARFLNQQFPSWHITRRDRKTGDEDDLIQPDQECVSPGAFADGKQVSTFTRYETESGLRCATWKAAKTVG